MQRQLSIPLLLVLGTLVATTMASFPGQDLWNFNMMDSKYGRIVGSIVEEGCHNHMSLKRATVILVQRDRIFDFGIEIYGNGPTVETEPIYNIIVTYATTGRVIRVTKNGLKYSLRSKAMRMRVFCGIVSNKRDNVLLPEGSHQKRKISSGYSSFKRKHNNQVKFTDLSKLHNLNKKRPLIEKRSGGYRAFRPKVKHQNSTKKAVANKPHNKVLTLKPVKNLKNETFLAKIVKRPSNHTFLSKFDTFNKTLHLKTVKIVKNETFLSKIEKRPSNQTFLSKFDTFNKTLHLKPVPIVKNVTFLSKIEKRPSNRTLLLKIEKRTSFPGSYRKPKRKEIVIGRLSVNDVRSVGWPEIRNMKRDTHFRFLITVSNQQLHRDELTKLFNQLVVVPRTFNETIIKDLGHKSRLVIRPIHATKVVDQCADKEGDQCPDSALVEDKVYKTKLTKFEVAKIGESKTVAKLSQQDDSGIDLHRYRFRVHISGGKATKETKKAIRLMMKESVSSNFNKQDFKWKNLKIRLELVYKKYELLKLPNVKIPVVQESRRKQNINTNGVFDVYFLEKFRRQYNLTEIKNLNITVKGDVIDGELADLNSLSCSMAKFASAAYDQIELVGSGPVEDEMVTINNTNVKLQFVGAKQVSFKLERDSKLEPGRISNLEMDDIKRYVGANNKTLSFY